MTTGRFVAWQPVLTDHQAYTFQALGRQCGHGVTAYVTRLQDEVRRAQGWTDVTADGVERRLLPARLTLLHALRALRSHRDDVHLFCSPFEQPALIACLVMACWMGLRVYMVSEPYSPGAEGYFGDGARWAGRTKAVLRPWLYRLYGALVGRRVAGVFAIGRLSVRQYQALGVPPGRVHPFGYFVPCAVKVEPVSRQAAPDAPLRLLFVGALIRRKGLDLLLQALGRLHRRGVPVLLDIYGPGEHAGLADAPDGVHHRGVLPFGQAQATMAAYDALVLPSRYDGWGVVVNEALGAGVPVVCSAECGASTLVERFGAGRTYPALDVAALEAALIELATVPGALHGMRAGAQQAAQAITPDAAAGYMLACIAGATAGTRPEPSPWYAVPPAPGTPTRSATRQPVRLHLTNVKGKGATQLLKSLLPAFERLPDVEVTEIHLPDTGDLAAYQPTGGPGIARTYRRRLPNVLSRLLECLVLAGRFSGRAPLIVLGDLPLRCSGPQLLFVQTPHLARVPVPANGRQRLGDLKYAISRWVMRRNGDRPLAVVVQTPVMRDMMAATYPDMATRLHIVPQPVPQWLLAIGPGTHRRRPELATGAPLRLFYPAAVYPHKNHRLLGGLGVNAGRDWPVEWLRLTIDPSLHPAPGVPWLTCVGMLDEPAMIEAYQACDALVFLSTDESFGFPLLEAMYLGMPVICPDLPYAHTLCGHQAIYFDPMSLPSLRQAVDELRQRLMAGWQPDWSQRLRAFPQSWDQVAASMVKLLAMADSPSAAPH